MRDLLSVMKEAKTSVERDGFALMIAQAGSMPDLDQDAIHTVGLAKQGLPELITFGLTAEFGSTVIAHLARLQISQGPFTHGREIKEEMFEEDSVAKFVMVEVNEKHLEKWFHINKALFGPEIEPTAMQVCWPDKDGKMPWEPGSALGDHISLGRKP